MAAEREPRASEESLELCSDDGLFGSPTGRSGAAAPPPAFGLLDAVRGAPMWLAGRCRAWIQQHTAWSRLFGPHQSLSPEERHQMQQYDTLDYIPSYSETYMRHLRRRRRHGDALKWIMFSLVGVSVGIVAFVIRQTIEFFSTERLAYIAWLMNDERERDSKGSVLSPSYGAAWLFSAFTSVLLVLLASLPVVYYWPKAAGGGVEEVIAYLNGVHMPRVFNVRTGIVKFFSCILAVSSGLPVGPEGPLIHLGAICGAGLTQGRSRTLGIQTKYLRRFRNNRDHRDFITAGAAAGISAAFGAPVGGLLFCMEEMATHWSPSLTWNIFFTSMVAFFTVSLFNSAFDGWHPTGTFGQFRNEAAVLFEVKHVVNLNYLAMLPAFIIGAAGGLMGAVFTLLNTRVNLWRRRVIAVDQRRRIMELICIASVWTTLCLLIPALPFFKCEPIRNGTEPLGDRFKWQTENRTQLVTFLCPDEDHYSPLATLTLSDNEGTIRRLFSRKTDPEFGYAPLLLFLAFYFGFACWTAGSAMSSGLLIPMMVIGATMGRIVGHWLVQVLTPTHDGTYLKHHEWIDPGVFALIGAGSFITGVSRLTVSITVIMLEISGELHFLLPIMLAVMIAKWVANIFTTSLYHTMLHLKNVPLLPLEPRQHLIDLERQTALDAVTNEAVVVIQEREKVRRCVDLLRTTTHNLFPALSGEEFQGVILRKDLEVLLQSPEIFIPDRASSVPAPPDIPPDGPRRLSVHALERRLSAAWGSEAVDWYKALTPGHFECYVDLGPYINRSPFTVQPHFSLKLTYELFTSLGLRHLIVLDGRRCVGVITRKDLLSQNLEDRLGPGALAERYHDYNRGPASPPGSPSPGGHRRRARTLGHIGVVTAPSAPAAPQRRRSLGAAPTPSEEFAFGDREMHQTPASPLDLVTTPVGP
eukprot:TRINITY_DN25497_c0_g1_i1.p1 TRINITY_DN25497_c0_g1~~TRINITY_DN25497_c0_g1_i1.p1  ORF type:complete len:956 (+),score=274.77 TRINITY_DN25497_c0_g1_i1:103-2868(+)